MSNEEDFLKFVFDFVDGIDHMVESGGVLGAKAFVDDQQLQLAARAAAE